MSDPVRQSPLPRPPFTGPCELWTGRLDRDGYGVKGHQRVHRLAYEAIHGRIPKQFQIDHLCMERACINVAHLEAVTSRVNTLRSPNTQASINTLKTHCLHGHEFTDENTAYSSRGHRKCRTCNRRCSVDKYRRMKEARECGDGRPYQKSRNGRPPQSRCSAEISKITP
jgi:HNH endonuclease